ncbi:hypothetical protein L1987_07054 [Smallanthus sonchifolius]|uniref:Uncharacterized protein n=1 Tax=Smallanthus sonchifolius TaxID=185202 RepID=A0ACB9K010_9ASTR|nr:hypothetical protein L1987_07054 [Smallanthus sonchifolius]
MTKAFVLLSSSIKKHRKHTKMYNNRKKLGRRPSKGNKGNPIEIDTNERLKTSEIDSTRKMLDFDDLDSDTPLNELKRSTEDLEEWDSDTPIIDLKRAKKDVEFTDLCTSTKSKRPMWKGVGTIERNNNIKKVLEKNSTKTVEKTVKEKKVLQGKNGKGTIVLKREKKVVETKDCNKGKTVIKRGKKEQKRNAVKEMGFARLLRFKMDRIPAKLAIYVVDKFNPEEMEIMLPCGSIKIDSEVIHQLLGLPKGGVSFSSLVELDIMDEGVSRWKNRYPGWFISPTKMVDQIEASDDEDIFEFRMDFLMCFVTIMLIYLESTKYMGMEVDPKVNPLSFWNMINLKERQRLEIQGGGFGVGPLKALSSYNDIECDEDTPVVDQMKEDIIIAKDQISSVLKGVNLEKGESSSNEEIEEQDQETDEQTDYKWTEGLENIVENEKLELDESCVSPCISQYKKIKSDCEVMQGDNREKDVTFLMRLDAKGGEYEASEESGFVAMLNVAVNVSIEEGDVAKKDETTSAMAAIPVTVINVTDIQTVNSGGSKSIGDNIYVDGQIATMGNEGVETSITNFEEQLVGIRNEEMTNIERNVEVGGEEIEKEVVITIGKEVVITTDNNMGKIIVELEPKRKNPLREKAITIYEKPPYQLRGFPWMLNDENTKKEKRMERFRKNMKATVKGDDKMADLKAFDMVLFPVLEFNHYYLLVFELKNTSISVIDNSCDKYPFVRMLNNKEYFKKDSCYKIADEEDGCTYPALASKCVEGKGGGCSIKEREGSGSVTRVVIYDVFIASETKTWSFRRLGRLLFTGSNQTAVLTTSFVACNI